MATAFALVGDRYHTSDYIRTALGRTLVQGIGLSVDFTDELTLLNAQHLSNYRLLIVFRDGMIWPNGYGIEAASVSEPPVQAAESRPVQWITEDQGRAVRSFVEAGGAALFYHNTTYIAPGSSDFRHVLGAATQGHPAVRPYRVHITRTDHPITRGVEDFVVEDEQHFMHYDKDPAHVLAVSVNDDGHAWQDLGTTCEAAWAYDYGAGRVCYLSPGHTIPALWNPAYEKLQQNAVRWLLRDAL